MPPQPPCWLIQPSTVECSEACTCLEIQASCLGNPERCCEGTVCGDNTCGGVGVSCLLPLGAACTDGSWAMVAVQVPWQTNLRASAGEA